VHKMLEGCASASHVRRASDLAFVRSELAARYLESYFFDSPRTPILLIFLWNYEGKIDRNAPVKESTQSLAASDTSLFTSQRCLSLNELKPALE
jgi:hypothetical protein